MFVCCCCNCCPPSHGEDVSSADVTHPHCTLRYFTKSDGVSLRPHLMTSSDRESQSHLVTGPRRSRSPPRASRCSEGGRCRWRSRQSPPSPGCLGHWCLNKVIIRAVLTISQQCSAHHVASLNLCLLYIAVYNVCDVVIAMAFCLSDNIQCCLIPHSPSVEWIGSLIMRLPRCWLLSRRTKVAFNSNYNILNVLKLYFTAHSSRHLRGYLHSRWLWTTRAKCSVSRTLESFDSVVSRLSFLNVL